MFFVSMHGKGSHQKWGSLSFYKNIKKVVAFTGILNNVISANAKTSDRPS